MEAHTPVPIRLPAPSKRRAVAFAVIGITCAATFALLWLWNPDAERDAIVKLPDPERRALYERTLRTLETTCSSKGRAGGLEDFCRSQAQFILRFSECDAACASVAELHRNVPAR